jgi:indole-3-glycerol phosphate synthase
MGVINESAIRNAHKVYHEHPVVVAISVLTQNSHFGGSPEELMRIRGDISCRPKPLLRKDFIFSEYEVYYSRVIGADAILLMANVVTDKKKFAALHDLATSLGMDVLCEVHDEKEIDLLPETARICGINSRKFRGANQSKPLWRKVADTLSLGPKHDTQTDLSAFALFDRLPETALKVAESGMSAQNVGEVLARYPFNAALIGTSLLKSGMTELSLNLTRIQNAAYDSLGKTSHNSPLRVSNTHRRRIIAAQRHTANEVAVGHS